jgi:hypothetical protein
MAASTLFTRCHLGRGDGLLADFDLDVTRLIGPGNRIPPACMCMVRLRPCPATARLNSPHVPIRSRPGAPRRRAAPGARKPGRTVRLMASRTEGPEGCCRTPLAGPRLPYRVLASDSVRLSCMFAATALMTAWWCRDSAPAGWPRCASGERMPHMKTGTYVCYLTLVGRRHDRAGGR